jgi:sulfur carrier protein ThiS
MSAVAFIVSDPFRPLDSRKRISAVVGASVSSLSVTDRRHIIIRNGAAVLRADWDEEIIEGDFFSVVVLPRGGGGGSNPLHIVAMLAVVVLAAYTGGAAFGAVGAFGAGSAGGAFGVSALGAGLVSAAVMVAGSALVNAVIPPASVPSSQQAAALASPSPTYNLQAQGNAARLEQAIPVQYGRLRCFPDFAAMPYLEYAGNEQYLYMLLCIGKGEYDIEGIYIEDTDIESFAEVETEIVPPGGALSLFPANVASSGEVSGQELLNGAFVGGFVANPAGTLTTKLGIDVVMPRGLYVFDTESGAIGNVSLTVQTDARLVDDDGVAIGAWVTLGTKTFTFKSTTPQRASIRYAVASGRYEVRMTRTDTKQTASNYGHEVVWAGLRAYLPGSRTFGNVTLLAIIMRASNNLSPRASRRINVVCTRKLPIFNGVSWSAPVKTASLAWAIADVCMNADYSVGLGGDAVDLAGLLELDAIWSARGDEFNGRFDATISFWEAITKICRAGRAKPFMQGGIIRVARDNEDQAPVALFNMRNIKRGSFSIHYVMPTEDTADAVNVSYFDEQTWTTRRVLAALPGGTTNKPAKVDLFGVTSRRLANIDGIYSAACNRYRRTFISFSTELEGLIPSYGDLIAVSHDMPMWGQSTGEIVGYDGLAQTILCSEPLVYTDGANHYIGMNRADGSLAGPYQVMRGIDDCQAILLDTLDFVPYTGMERERTRFSFGPGEAWRKPAKVLAVTPRGMHDIRIDCVNDDPAVYTAEEGSVTPPVQYSSLPTLFTVPVISSLSIKSSVPDAMKILLAWTPAPGADNYHLEMAAGVDPYAEDLVWTRVAESTANNAAVTALYGAQTLIRVRGVGMSVGPWKTAFYGDESDFMWSNDTALMWDAVDTTLMWRY